MSTPRDPLRLVLDPACPESERGLLLHGANIAPPHGAEDRVWLALAGAIGVGGAGATAGATTTATTTTTTTTATVEAGLTPIKIVGLAVVLAGLVTLVSYLAGRNPAHAPPVPTAETPAVAPPQAPPLPPAAETPPAEDAPPADNAERSRPAPGARRSLRAAASPAAASPLRQEITLIKEARQALRDGDAARALRVLADCRRLHPAGVLVQERERLTVEALIAGGRASEASARASEFLRKYPDSPHAGEVRELARRASGSR